VPEQAAREWAEETSGGCALHIFEGGHFFIHQQQWAVLDCLIATLNDIDNNTRKPGPDSNNDREHR
jgi:surfactin synthase thioesterase subunit